jgi:hypothetical protein
MGVAAIAPAIGLVSTVAGIASRNAEISAQNRAITSQQEANARAAKVREMGIQLQMQQVKQQTELDKLSAEAQYQQANASFDLEDLTRRASIAQELAAVDLQLAEASIAQVTQQYQLAQQAFEQQEALSQQRTQELNKAAQDFNQIEQVNQQLISALRSGDFSTAEALSRQIGAFGSTEGVDARRRQQEYEALRTAYNAEGYSQDAQRQLVANDEYYQFLNKAITAELARNQEMARLQGSAQQQSGNLTKDSARQYSKSSEVVDNMSRALLPSIRDANINQANINEGYSMSALRNASLESKFGTVSANAALEAQRPRRSILSDLALVAQASVPLFRSVNFARSTPRPTTLPTSAHNFYTAPTRPALPSYDRMA